MSDAARPMVIGNWKMNGTRDALPVIREIAAGVEDTGVVAGLCVPNTLLYVATTLTEDSALLVGAQDCHPEPSGAHTGDVSAEMLADCFAALCIVGHSERRADHGETDTTVRAKALACRRAGITPVICVGETEEENRAGRTREVLERQVRRSLPDDLGAAPVVLAYEPVWAIGTGLVPSAQDVATIHADLRALLTGLHPAGRAVPILYGGSVKPGNAAELLDLPDVGGALVGGASLTADDFLGICHGAS